MTDTFFCSDTHFKHKHILEFQPNRVFESLEEHDETLIDNWNNTVSPKDDVWFLGDFIFGSQAMALEYLSRLNGHIHFIIGNHDTKVIRNVNFQRQLSFLGDYYELKGFHKMPIVLFHYPMLSWNRSFHSSYHFHGHCHNSIDNTGTNRRDVGIDISSNQRPFHIDELIL